MKPSPSSGPGGGARVSIAACCWALVMLLLVGCMSFLGSMLGVMYSLDSDLAALAFSPGNSLQGSSNWRQAELGAASDALATHGEDPVAPSQEPDDAPSSPGGAQRQAPGGPAPFPLDVRWRAHWKELEQICNDRNYSSCKDKDRSGWTDATKTTFSTMQFAGLGQWSTFTMQTYNQAGAIKSKGGDTWYITLRETERLDKLPTRVFDNGDGTYTVAVYFLFPGSYRLVGWLYYSDCLGYQEPLHDTNYIFSNHDKYFNEMTKEDQCYIGQRMQPPDLLFKVDESARPLACNTPDCSAAAVAKNPDIKAKKSGHTWRAETYHYFRNGTYFSMPCCKARLPIRKAKDKPFERLLFMGDSTVFHSWKILVQGTRRPCNITWKPRLNDESLWPDSCPPLPTLADMDPALDEIGRRCTGGVPWSTVPIGADSDGAARNSKYPMYFNMEDFKYNDTWARNHNPPVPLPLPREFTVVMIDSGTMRTVMGIHWSLQGTRENDLIILNLGHHYTRLQRFSDWKKFMDELIVDLMEIRARTGCMIVWRSTFLLKENVFRSFSKFEIADSPELRKAYVNTARFNTDARRLLFESYAEDALVKAGVHIWDVYGLSAVGDYRWGDMFHAGGPATWVQNLDMLDLFACKA